MRRFPATGETSDVVGAADVGRKRQAYEAGLSSLDSDDDRLSKHPRTRERAEQTSPKDNTVRSFADDFGPAYAGGIRVEQAQATNAAVSSAAVVSSMHDTRGVCGAGTAAARLSGDDSVAVVSRGDSFPEACEASGGLRDGHHGGSGVALGGAAGAALEECTLLWVKQEGDPSFIKLRSRAADVEHVATKLGVKERLSTLTVHLADVDEEGNETRVHEKALPSRMSLAAAGLANNVSIVVKVAAPARGGLSMNWMLAVRALSELLCRQCWRLQPLQVGVRRGCKLCCRVLLPACSDAVQAA